MKCTITKTAKYELQKQLNWRRSGIGHNEGVESIIATKNIKTNNVGDNEFQQVNTINKTFEKARGMDGLATADVIASILIISSAHTYNN